MSGIDERCMVYAIIIFTINTRIQASFIGQVCVRKLEKCQSLLFLGKHLLLHF